MKLTVHEVKHLTDLYELYPQQFRPQPCFIELQLEERILRADFNPEIGTFAPMAVHDGLWLRWGINPLTNSAANQLLAKIEPLASRIVKDFEEDEDSRGNESCVLGEDAKSAADEIQELCRAASEDENCVLLVMEAADFMADSDWEPTGQESDQEIHGLADDYIQYSDIHMVPDLEEWMRDRRDEVRESTAG